jgi:hypothetical protein
MNRKAEGPAVFPCPGNKSWVAHISLVFREMWDSTGPLTSGLNRPTGHLEKQPVLQRISIDPYVITVQHLTIQDLDR